MKKKDQRGRWGWEIALEMFFIGSASGAFLSIFFLQVITGIDFSTNSLCIPLILSLMGIVFLLKELGHPVRAWRSIFNLRSTISLGAIIMSAFILVIGLLALHSWTHETKALGTFLLGLATLLAIGSALYPGILMAEIKARDCVLSNLAPILFLASSLSTGAAWLILEGAFSGVWVVPAALPTLNLVVFSFVLVQLVILVSWAMLGYRLSEEKWLEILRLYRQEKQILILVGTGLVIPLFSIPLVNQTISIMVVQSCLILVSGMALRLLLLLQERKIELKEIRYLLQLVSR